MVYVLRIRGANYANCYCLMEFDFLNGFLIGNRIAFSFNFAIYVEKMVAKCIRIYKLHCNFIYSTYAPIELKKQHLTNIN